MRKNKNKNENENENEKENENDHDRTEGEFQELETRISTLEQELSNSRQFITVLGTKVLEMEAKVFQGK